MNQQFFQSIFNKQQETDDVPANSVITGWAEQLVRLLYPEVAKQFFSSPVQFESAFQQLEISLVSILETTRCCLGCDNRERAHLFFRQLPEIYRLLNADVDALVEGDPAAKSEFEVIRTYPGFFAICFYRIAHALHDLGVPMMAHVVVL